MTWKPWVTLILIRAERPLSATNLASPLTQRVATSEMISASSKAGRKLPLVRAIAKTQHGSVL
jgi:hypothetical protein